MADAGSAAPPKPRAALLWAAALVLTVGWLATAGWLLAGLPAERGQAIRDDPWSLALSLVATTAPVVLIWVVAALVQTARALRADRERMRRALAALSDPGAGERRARTERSLHEGIRELRADHAALAAELAALRGPHAPAPGDAGEATADEEAAPPADAFIRALNFPDDGEDTDGFDVLRRALRHRGTARLVDAAQEVLTLLAQDGIYMEDLAVQPADPVLWRALAAGTDGAAALESVRDRSSLALTAGRMQDDAVFRAAVERFLHRFEKAFRDFAERASDAEVRAFAETRTARAYLLCARATR